MLPFSFYLALVLKIAFKGLDCYVLFEPNSCMFYVWQIWKCQGLVLVWVGCRIRNY